MPHIDVRTVATSVGAEGVGASNIATGAVTEAKLAAEAVTAAKTKVASALPVFGGGKGEQVLGTAYVAKQVVIALNAKETEKAYKKVKHKLKNEYPQVVLYKTSTKTEVLPTSYSVVAENAEEFELVTSLTIADKEEFYVVVTG